MSKFNWTIKAQRDGMALVMSLLILTLIMTSVLAMAKIIIGEIRMSLNTGNSVAAFYAAESGIEKSLYYLKYARQNLSYHSFSQLAGTNEDMGNDSSFNIVQATTSTVQFVANNLTTSTPAQVNIMDPLGYIGGGINWGDNDPSALYQYSISWSIDKCFPSHASDRIEISTTNFENMVGGGSNYFNSDTYKQILSCRCAFDTGICSNSISFYNLSSNKYYSFSFRPLDGNVRKLTFNLTKISGGNTTPVGILSETSIVVDGNYRNSSYRLNARMSSIAPINSIFNYVVFSEQAISKGF